MKHSKKKGESIEYIIRNILNIMKRSGMQKGLICVKRKKVESDTETTFREI